MSKSKVKEEYLLTDKDLKKLESVSVRNPRRPGWNHMQLYVTLQVEAKSVEKHGSIEAMEKLKVSKTKNRMKKKEKAITESQTTNALAVSIKRLRSEASLEIRGSPHKKTPKHKESKKRKKKNQEEVKYVPRYREHKFGQPVRKSTSEWVKICQECEFEVQYEEL